MDRIRTFIAVLLPEEIRSRLGEIEEKLVETGADVKWVLEDNFHITLKFLGGVEANRMDAVADAVKKAAEGIEPFEMLLEGAGAFPGLRRPRVVWVGIKSGMEPLRTIAGRVESALEKLGFPREERPFSAHVTLGRVRTPRGADALGKAIESLREVPVGSVRVDGVAVMKSDLRPTGPVYTPLKEFELTG